MCLYTGKEKATPGLSYIGDKNCGYIICLRRIRSKGDNGRGEGGLLRVYISLEKGISMKGWGGRGYGVWNIEGFRNEHLQYRSWARVRGSGEEVRNEGIQHYYYTSACEVDLRTTLNTEIEMEDTVCTGILIYS